MKKIIFVIAYLISSLHPIDAQKIHYEPTLKEAKEKSLTQGKPLAILLTIEPPVPSPNFLNGLNDQTVIQRFNDNFINYMVAREDTAVSNKIISVYKIYRFPSFIFLDAKGGLMFTDIAILSRSEFLLVQIDKAIAAVKEKSLVDYDNDYDAGNVNAAFLKEYILRRKKAGITNNADLIERYVNGLAVSDLNNYAEILFILKAGPLADSTAYRLALARPLIIDSIFKTEPLADRIAMNNATIENTMAKAIAEKNIKRATAAANFSRNTWKTNRTEGQKSWSQKMLQYYYEVRDTANYLQMAGFFYDQYYMNLSIDSIKRKESLSYEAAKNSAKENAMRTTPDSLGKRSFSFSYAKNSYAAELNNAAWNIYLLAGSNNQYLSKAILWIKRAIDFDAKSAFYDTYAHLLYRQNLYNESENMEKKAIESGKMEKQETGAFEKEYEKIKNRRL